MKKIPLIYILSNGRSGTTLLDLLLGAHEKIWTVGEVHNLPWELINPRAPCGCGNPVHESEFWKPIIDKLPTEPKGYHIGYFHNSEQVGKVLRWRLLPDVVRGEVSSRWENGVERYNKNNQKLFSVVKDAAENRLGHELEWVVDASKNMYRLFWLQQSSQFDIRVIHLIKDPRSLVYSMARPWLPKGVNRVFRYTIRWVVENAIMNRICNQMKKENVYRLKYENVARSPEKTMKEIGEWIGVDYPKSRVHDFKKYDNYAISGNMMRWRESDDEIRLDERWKREFSRPYQALVYGFSRPFFDVCGYSDVLDEHHET